MIEILIDAVREFVISHPLEVTWFLMGLISGILLTTWIVSKVRVMGIGR